MPAADQVAIVSTLGALFAGFSTRAADLLDAAYADDADWVNAFGSVKKGRAEILAYLRGLFTDDNFIDGVMVAPPASRLRRLTDTVVAVSTHLQVRGQGLVGGGSIALRDNYSLRILQKQVNSEWRVVSEMYMDARQDQSYLNHS